MFKNLKKKVNKKIYVYSFYRFIKIKNKISLKKNITSIFKNANLRGTILIASEGINGSIAGEEIELLKVIRFLRGQLHVRKLNIKVNETKFLPFNKFKVRLKKEIVSLGKGNIKIKNMEKTYIHPSKWNKLIEKNNINLIDTRNIYEISIGKFKHAINPKTNSFREFPSKMKDLNVKKNDNIALYCTGGIRCEKAPSYLKESGYKNVFQLKGGILSYLDYVKSNNLINFWRGECFVFDNRVTVDRDLVQGKYQQCFGCRRPINEDDIKSKKYKKGVHCPYCFDIRSKEQKRRAIMRQNQISLAEQNGMDHPFKKKFS